MKVNGEKYKTIWPNSNRDSISIIDQTLLPHKFIIKPLFSLDDVVNAIKDMHVRGAPLIGVTAAYGLALAMKKNSSDAFLKESSIQILNSRPTAINLKWAVDRMNKSLIETAPSNRFSLAWSLAEEISNEDIERNMAIGINGLKIMKDIAKSKANEAIQILTHCNAGWLATVDYGTALSPIYQAHQEGINLHVWVDETRPRNQGAHLTAWELLHEKIPHTLIADNTGGHLMQNNGIDLVIVGADRISSQGDVCNKIGTYLKALAAHANKIPFYVAAPSSTIDNHTKDFLSIPIELRAEEEVLTAQGIDKNGEIKCIRIAPEGTNAYNPAFDITPNKYITKIITENGTFNPGDLKKFYA
jgi:methylthioribose-1-phosphate isomerase